MLNSYKKNIFISMLLCITVFFTSSVAFSKDLVIAWFTPNLSMPFDTQLYNVAKNYADKKHVKLLSFDAQGNTLKQVNDLRSVILQKPDAIILTPNDSNALRPVVEKVIKAGIPIVTIDRKIFNTSKKVNHFGADGYLGGKLIANELKKLFPNGVRMILITGDPGTSVNAERMSGIKEGLSENGYKHEILVEQNGKWFRSEGQRIVSTSLPALGNKVDAIVTANDDEALGAVMALKSMDLLGKIKVLGYDGVPEMLQDINKGWAHSTLDQDPAKAVRLAFDSLIDTLNNNTTLKDGKYPPILITKTNLQEAGNYKKAFPNGIN